MLDLEWNRTIVASSHLHRTLPPWRTAVGLRGNEGAATERGRRAETMSKRRLPQNRHSRYSSTEAMEVAVSRGPWGLLLAHAWPAAATGLGGIIIGREPTPRPITDFGYPVPLQRNQQPATCTSSHAAICGPSCPQPWESVFSPPSHHLKVTASDVVLQPVCLRK